jgi:hypothetical protein
MERPFREGGLAPDGEWIEQMFGDDINDVPGMDMADRFTRLAVENADDVAKLFDDPDSIINPSVDGFFQAAGVDTDPISAALKEVLGRGRRIIEIIDSRDATRGAGLDFKVRGHEYAAIASALSGANLGHVLVCRRMRAECRGRSLPRRALRTPLPRCRSARMPQSCPSTPTKS